MNEVTRDECMVRLREWIDAPHPETVQVGSDDTEVVREILRRILQLAKGKGFLTGLVDLAAVERSLGPRPAGLGLDSVFQDWALKGAANSKMIQWLASQASPRAPALMIIDALEYPGPEHIIDIKTRIRALNNQIDQLRLWILFAHSRSSSDLVASNLATGRLHVAR